MEATDPENEAALATLNIGGAASIPEPLAEKPRRNTVEIGGGDFHGAHVGPTTQNIKNQSVNNSMTMKQVQKRDTYHITYVYPDRSPVPQATNAAAVEDESDTIQLSGPFYMFHNKKLSNRDHIFLGEKRSDVIARQKLAIKSLPYSESSKQEAQTLINLEHENIVSIVHSDTYKLDKMKFIFIAMELCHEQNLYDSIQEDRRNNVPFDAELAVRRARQLVSGLRYIHGKGVLHGDLKPHNILLSLCKRYLKIGDFGLSKQLKFGRSTTSHSIFGIGTDGYRAPETYIKNIISKGADIFSLALVLYHVWSYGSHAYGDDPDDWNGNIKRNRNRNLEEIKVPNAEAARELLESMLQTEPELRPKSWSILSHRFFIEQSGPRDVPVVSTEDAPERSSERNSASSTSGSPGAQRCQGRPASTDAATYVQLSSSPLVATPEPQTLETSAGKDAEANSVFVENNDRSGSGAFGESASPVDTRPLFSPGSTRPCRSDGCKTLQPVAQEKEKIGERLSASMFEKSSPEMVQRQRPRSQRVMSAGWLPTPLEPVGNTNQGLILFDKLSGKLQAIDCSHWRYFSLQVVPSNIMENAFTAVMVRQTLYTLLSNGSVYSLQYTDENSKWTRLPNTLAKYGPRPPAAVLNDTIYLVGCTNIYSSMNAEKFNPEEGKWEKMKSMEKSRIHHTLASAGRSLYCIGGEDGTSILRSVKKLNPLDGSGWEDISMMKRARSDPAATELSGKLYVLGGLRKAKPRDERQDNVEYYNPTTRSWTEIRRMLVPRAMFQAFNICGNIFAIGGDSGFPDHKKTVEYHKVENNTWNEFHASGRLNIDFVSSVPVKVFRDLQ